MNFIDKYFDKIIFIHCKHRLDRMENIKLLLEKTKLTNYIILEATYLPKNGAKGCSHSHYRAMDMALKNNWDKVLIIEDDFQFNNNLNFEEIINSINNDWDVLMPYWCINGIFKRTKRINKFIRKVINKKYGAFTTSCYAVNKNIISILRDLFLLSYNKQSNIYKRYLENNLTCDNIWFAIQHKYKWFIIDPKLGYTINSKSDIC